MMFLLGRQAMLGQAPPMYLRSTVATRCPCSANVQARNFEPVPLPRITRSYSSGSVILGSRRDEALTILLIENFSLLNEFPPSLWNSNTRCKGERTRVSTTGKCEGRYK